MSLGGSSAEQQQWRRCHTQLLQRLRNTPRPADIYDSVSASYSSQLREVEELLTRALTEGESNSALLVGPRHVGKTALVRCALSRHTPTPDCDGSPLCAQLGAEQPDGVLVRLHGLLHTDDRLALREITRQLRLEDSAASRQFGSFAENLTWLLNSLKHGSRASSKVVVFILDEFDLFTKHRNQTLLYNLLDVAQSAQNPVLVLGLSCDLDAVELLEKRVRSRFSHRKILLHPPTQERHSDIAEQLMELSDCPGLSAAEINKFNKSISSVLASNAVLDSLAELHCVSSEVGSLQRVLRLAVGWALAGARELTAEDITASVALHNTEVTLPTLNGLTTLQLCLVIAMMHLTNTYGTVGFTFELVLSEYLKFTRRRSSVPAFERPIVFKEFQHLKELELVLPAEQGGSRTFVQQEYQLMTLQLHPQVLQECFAKMTNLQTDLLQWAQSALA